MKFLKKLFLSDTLMLGLAMFCMFFGAGNVIFPLHLGQICQDNFYYGLLGIFFTAVFMPFMGVFAMILFDGQTKPFFNRFGKIIGVMVSFILMILLGPFASTPRCVALSYSSFKSFFPTLDPNLFIVIVSVLLYFSTKNKQVMMNLLGKYITPLLLLLLGTIIAVGVFSEGTISKSEISTFNSFNFGLKEGYNTMDLVASFFFSSSIIQSLKKITSREVLDAKLFKKAIFSSVIGAFLLFLTYAGFAYLAAKHSIRYEAVPKEFLLQNIMIYLIGEKAAFIVAIVVSLACLTTAMALLSVFVEFLQKEVKLNRISESVLLIICIIITALIARLEFNGISAMMGSVLKFLYPFLIFLTLLQIFEKLFMNKLPLFSKFSRL